jgi:hypothetical protein
MLRRLPVVDVLPTPRWLLEEFQRRGSVVDGFTLGCTSTKKEPPPVPETKARQPESQELKSKHLHRSPPALSSPSPAEPPPLSGSH